MAGEERRETYTEQEAKDRLSRGGWRLSAGRIGLYLVSPNDQDRYAYDELRRVFTLMEKWPGQRSRGVPAL